MSVSVTFNGNTYSIPSNREPKGWGTSLSSFLVAVGNNALSKAGGAFTLTADANFGANYGIITKYVRSATANIALTEVVRLGNNEGIAWRNQANGADKVLKVNTSDRLEYDAVAVPTISSTDTLTNKTIDGDDNTVQDLPLTSLKTDLANASKFIERDASGIPVSGKAVPTGDVVGTSDTQTLTNKTLTTPTIDDYLIVNEETAPGTPASGKQYIYSTSTKRLYAKNSDGTEVELGKLGNSGSSPIAAGMVGEWKETAVSGASTSLANTWTAGTGSLELEAGTWEIGYDVSIQIKSIDPNIRVGGNVAIYDGSAILDKTISVCSIPDVLPTNSWQDFSLSRRTVVDITVNTTYSIQTRCSFASSGTSSDSEVRVVGLTAGLGLSSPSNYSMLWARRL